MRIIDDERNIKTVGKCEQCLATAVVRSVESVGWSGEGRGYFTLCFSCLGPRIFWKENERGQVFETPAESFLTNRSSRPATSATQDSDLQDPQAAYSTVIWSCYNDNQ